MVKKLNLMRVALSFLAIFLLLVPMNVSASDHMDYWEQLGMSYEEYIDELDEDGVHTFYPPTTYEASDPYVIEENIKLGAGGILFVANGDAPVNRVIPFGEALAIGNNVRYIYLTLYNNNSPLFEKGGVFNAELYVYSTAVRMTVYRTDGSSVTNIIDSGNSEIHYVPISINNDNADITEIEIVYYGPVSQSTGGVIMSAGIMRYGYILNPVPEENHTKNIFELLRDWTGNFFGNMMDSLNNYDGTGVNDASSKFDQSAGELDSVESDLTNITNSSIETYTDSAFDISVIASLGSSLVYVVTWFTNFWNMGGLFSSILNTGLALTVAFFILRLRGGD